MKTTNIRTKRHHVPPHATQQEKCVTEVIFLPKMCKGNEAKCEQLMKLGKGYIGSFYCSFNFSVSSIYMKTYRFFKYMGSGSIPES